VLRTKSVADDTDSCGVFRIRCTQVLVADGAETEVAHCSADAVLAERQCGDLKVVIMDAAKMPYITRNIALAWGEGYD